MKNKIKLTEALLIKKELKEKNDNIHQIWPKGGGGRINKQWQQKAAQTRKTLNKELKSNDKKLKQIQEVINLGLEKYFK